MTFEGKKVVVTGGTGALGSAVSQAFLAAGAKVHSSYIVDAEIENLTSGLRENNHFKTTKVNLTDETSVRDWFSEIDGPDILVNVAGGFSMSMLRETDYSAWQHMINMNLNTAFLTSREAVRLMTGHGRIINVGAFAATRVVPGMCAYTTSKGGVIHLTEVLAEETLAEKITVNAVLPTIMDTPGNRAAMPDADFSTWVPLENVEDTVLFLADEKSWHITGACIPLRGHS